MVQTQYLAGVFIILACIIKNAIMNALTHQQTKTKTEKPKLKQEQQPKQQNTELKSLFDRKKQIEATIQQFNTPSTFAKYSKMQREINKLNNQIENIKNQESKNKQNEQDQNKDKTIQQKQETRASNEKAPSKSKIFVLGLLLNIVLIAISAQFDCRVGQFTNDRYTQHQWRTRILRSKLDYQLNHINLMIINQKSFKLFLRITNQTVLCMSKKSKGNKHKYEQEKVQNAYIGPNCIKQHPQGIAITIGAKPNAKASRITQINDQYVGVSIAAQPRDGQANQQLVRYFGQVFGTRKKGVSLVAGQKSKDKVLILEGKQFTRQYVFQRLQKQIQ